MTSSLKSTWKHGGDRGKKKFIRKNQHYEIGTEDDSCILFYSHSYWLSTTTKRVTQTFIISTVINCKYPSKKTRSEIQSNKVI